MKRFLFIIFFLYSVALFANQAMDILKKVDDNTVFSSITYTGTMEVHKNNIVFSKKFKAYAKGQNKAFIKFINDEDVGVKYLKKGDDLWLAEDEDIVKISGHLLKNSMMGSDFSYEDSLANDKLEDLYSAKILKTESVQNRECFVIELDAKKKTAPYKKQIIWVDKTRFIALKTQYFALSGKLLKEMVTMKTEKISGHYFVTKIKMINKIRKNNYTLFSMSQIQLNKPVSDSLFTLQHLERE